MFHSFMSAIAESSFKYVWPFRGHQALKSWNDLCIFSSISIWKFSTVICKNAKFVQFFSFHGNLSSYISSSREVLALPEKQLLNCGYTFIIRKYFLNCKRNGTDMRLAGCIVKSFLSKLRIWSHLLKKP